MKKLVIPLLIVTTLAFYTPLPAYAAGPTDFISCWDLEETSGDRLDASTTPSNDLTDNNTVLYQTGVVGNAADFELDTSEYLSITDATQQGLDVTTTDFTVAMWVKTETFNSGDNYYLMAKWIAGGSSYLLGIRNPSGVQSMQAFLYNSAAPTSNRNYFSSNTTISNATWYYLEWSWDIDTETMHFYKDGAGIGSTTDTGQNNINDSAAVFSIGGSGALASYFDGLIDQVIFIKRTFTSAERANLYNGGSGVSCIEAVSSILSSPDDGLIIF